MSSGARGLSQASKREKENRRKFLPRLKTTGRQMVFGTDLPHGDRESFARAHLAKRKDISVFALTAKLQTTQHVSMA
jgi:hypothetical protein